MVMSFIAASEVHIFLLFFLNVLLTAVLAQAPGDGDSFCTSTLPTSGGIPLPPTPPNAKILMDSYVYRNLLPPHDSPVWQQVDLDNNNMAGSGTSWSQNTNTPCRQDISVCGFNSGNQNNWLITNHINRVVNGTKLPQVSVLVEFEQAGCDQGCQRTFVLEAYETSTVDSTTARNTSNYGQIDRVAPFDDSGTVSQNQTREMNFQTNEDGFYLAIRDESTCIVVSRLLVFYNVCPQETVGFVMRPETLSPIIERLSTPIEVAAQCVAGASPDNGGALRLTCSQGGVWGTIAGSGCTCDPGFVASEDGTLCMGMGCPAGMYGSAFYKECRVCPKNSESLESGLSACTCDEDYYRAVVGEEDLPCTQPPSEPRNVRIVSTTSTTINLEWDPPLSLGGRNDTMYILWYQVAEEDNNPIMEGPTVSTTMGTITGLTAGVQYNAFVTAINGIAEQVNMSLLEQIPASPVSSSSSTVIIVVVMVILLVAALVVTVIVLIVVILRRKGNSKSRFDIEHEVIPIPVKGKRTYVDPLTYASPDEAVQEFAKEIEPKVLRLDAGIGSGEFGTVFRGVWKEQQKKAIPVAVKTLKPGSSGKMRTDFLNEASIMGQFQHDHVIKLYGVVTKVDPAMIVMEFMDNGSLYSYLRANDEKLNNQRLLQMARCVSSGMEYLSTVGYVHRDLAARNILVGKDEVCKVADFGLSREVIDDEYNVQKGGKIPVRWTAPEAIYRRKFTSSSDMWSFGVLLWEVMTYAQHPYDDWDNQMVLDQLDSGYRLECPHECPDAVYELMLDCWNQELSSRPSFTDVLKRLDLLLSTDSPPKRPPKKVRNSMYSGATNPLQYKSVEDWLESVKMERYIPTFQESGVNSVNQLVHLTEIDLRDMGITLAGHLNRLTQSIDNGYSELKRNSSVAAP